ncbi:MAG: NADH-quinone oxidoreductase subunit M [Acidobacteria bacterium]|nr:NADH-quinone oxidoreductase subunit M [Acidobacteriota bacterium]
MALTILILLPLTGAVAVWALAGLGRVEPARRLGLGVSIWTLVATLATWVSFDPAAGGFQFVARVSWGEPFAVSYHVGVDGLSLALVTVAAWFTPLALLLSRRVRHRAPAAFVALVLLFEASAIAAFSARDLLLFFVSADAMVMTAFALIGVWGRDRRVYAATRLLLSHLVGSSLMLIAIIWMAWRHQVATGFWSFALADLVALDLPAGVQTWPWLAFVLAFAIRAPLFPLHTWLPDVLAQAPAPVGVLIGGVLANVGGYGLFRIVFPLLPEASLAFAPWFALLAVAGTTCGAIVAMAQSDLRRVVAYLSISQMGVVVLGVCSMTTEGTQGGLVHLLTRALWTSGLLLIAGLLAERRGTTEVAQFGGLWRVVPGLSAMLLLLAVGAMALPGTGSFAGVVRALSGTFDSSVLMYGRWLGGLAVVGVLLWGLGMLRLARRMVAGPITRDRNRGLRDLAPGEWMILVPVAALVIAVGLWPDPWLGLIEPSVRDALIAVAGLVAPGER